MTDSSHPITSADQKRVLKRNIWLLFGACLLLVLVIIALLALSSHAQVGVVNQVMTMIVCFLPVLVVLLALWVAVAAAIFSVSRLEVKVTGQLATLEGRAFDAKTRARTAGLALGRAVIKVVARTAIIERWLSAFEPKPNQDEADEQ